MNREGEEGRIGKFIKDTKMIFKLRRKPSLGEVWDTVKTTLEVGLLTGFVALVIMIIWELI